MKSHDLVSIVIPAFNAATVLRDALTSVEKQSYRDFEAIVVDDGSTDDTAAIAREFAERDPRFSLVSQPNQGVSNARNAAIQRAKGDMVAFLDADDVWFEDKLTRQLAAMQQTPEANVVFSNYFLWDGQRDIELRYKEQKKFPQNDFRTRLIHFNLFGISTILVKRDLLRRVGMFDPKLAPAEDWDMWLRMSEAGWHATGIWEPLTRYRCWSGNASKQTLRMAKATLAVLETRLAFCPDAELKASYRDSVAIARAHLEFAKIRPSLNDRQLLASAAFRAWCHYPRRIKWLLWYLATLCPAMFGGNFLSGAVRKKIEARW